MAYRLSEQESYITIPEKEYLALVRDGMFMAALRLSGVLKKDGVMEAIESIMKDPRVEIHVRPIKKHYR
jgi:urease gamma subunit